MDNLENFSPGDDPDTESYAVVEGLLFASGDPLPLGRIAEVLEVAPARAKSIIDGLALLMERSRRGGLLVREVNGKYQLCTKPEIGARVAKLFELKQKHGLSQAAYETLAIVAYNTNATKALIEKIRGVNSDSAVERLVERGLVVEKGRLRMPGRPMAYDVTDDFYRNFGFRSKKDLPDFSADAGVGLDAGVGAGAGAGSGAGAGAAASADAGAGAADVPQQLMFADGSPPPEDPNL